MIDRDYMQKEIDKLDTEDLEVFKKLLDENISSRTEERFNLLVENIVNAARKLQKEFPYAELQDCDGEDWLDLIQKENFVRW